MIAIKDMKMPDACGECRFCLKLGTCHFFCKANNDKCINRDVNFGDKNKDCPLREVKK